MSNELAKTSPANPVQQIVAWILAGHAQEDVIDAAKREWPDQKPRPLIVQALKQLAKAGEPDVTLVKGFCIEATREIFRKAMEVGDHATGLRAIAQLMQLAEK